MILNNIHELDEYLSKLSKEELEELRYWVGGYESPLVGIDEFLESPEFLGPVFMDEEGNHQVFEYWRGILRQIYQSPYHDKNWLICLRGAIGLGKTTIACVGLAYDIYRLIERVNPQKDCGLWQGSKIVFAILNRTLSLSSDVVWDKLSQIFTRSPYFSKHMGILGSRRKDRDTMFPKRVDIVMGSRIGHTLGKDVIETVMDEANFDVVEDQMYKNFNSIMARMESRFTKPGGGIMGKIWVISSESDKFSTVNKIVDQYKNRKGVLISQAPLWEVKNLNNGVPIYSGKRFHVFAGSDTRKPEVIEEDNILKTELPELCISVPVEHRDRFEADINAALRDLAGVSTGSSYKLFRLRDRLTGCFTVHNPLPETLTLDFFDDTDQIINYVINRSFLSTNGIPRHIHLDMGLSGDLLGVSSSYIKEFKERRVKDPITYNDVVEEVPHVVTEFSFGIRAKPGSQIPLFKVRLFLIALRNSGYPIGKVTADLQMMSADTLQGLTAMGFTAEYLSVDRTTVPYICLRSAVYEGRADLPIHELLKKEMLDLEVTPDGSKVDHTMHGSKDIADSLCGSVYSAIQNAASIKFLLLNRDNYKSGAGQGVTDMFWGR